MEQTSGNIEYDGLTDEDLVLLAQEGDKTAEELIYKKYQYLPKYIINKYQLSIRHYDTEDLIQNGYIFASAAIKSFKPGMGASFKTFLIHVMKKRYYDFIYSCTDSSLNEIAICDMAEYEEERLFECTPPENEHLVYDMIDAKELLEEIRSLLTEKEYRCIVLRYKNVPLHQISCVMGIEYKKLDNMLQTIRKKKLQNLRKRMI